MAFPVPSQATFLTVVTGVPRSGTSLMMQMLGEGGVELLTDATRPPDADNPRGYFEFRPVMGLQRDVSFLDDAAGKAVKVVHALVPSLPEDRELRVILMRRDLAEVIASQQRMLARRGAATDEIPEDRLAEIFRLQIEEARRWLGRNDRASLLEVDYHALLAAPSRWAATVDDFLGGGLDRAAMAGAVDPDLWRQRRSSGG